MSSTIDLDFHDYTPTKNDPSVKVQQDTVSKIPSQSYPNQSIPNKGSSKEGQSSSTTKDEAIQQLIWLSGKLKNKQQRDTITANSNWGLGYLAQYFDVTTKDVLERIVWSNVPFRKRGLDLDDLQDLEPLSAVASSSTNFDDSIGGSRIEGEDGGQGDSQTLNMINKRKYYSFVERFIQARPDFYGPLWISTTLIFTVAIFSNLISFMNYRSRIYPSQGSFNSSIPVAHTDDVKQEEWHYSTYELSAASTIVLSYITILPTFLWLIFWFRGYNNYYSLAETICAYGYSISIFVPISGVFIIQQTFIRYLLIILASLTSGVALTASFLPVIKNGPSAFNSHSMLFFIAGCHVGLAYLLHRTMLI